MSVITMKQLLEAGVHFGHQARRWNPKCGISFLPNVMAFTLLTFNGPSHGCCLQFC